MELESSQIDLFWKQFKPLALRLSVRDFDGRPAREIHSLVETALAQLLKMAPGVSMSISPSPEGGLLATVSARGVYRWFGHVRQIVRAAPAIPGWTVRAFHPPRALALVVSKNALELQTAGLRFNACHMLGRWGVMLIASGLDVRDYTDGYAIARQIVMDAVGEENFGQLVADAQLMDQDEWEKVAPGQSLQPIEALGRLFAPVSDNDEGAGSCAGNIEPFRSPRRSA